jgi:hypothetical protein
MENVFTGKRLDVKMLKDERIPKISQKEKDHIVCRMIAHYIFRNGPIEDMHSDGKLCEGDMYVLNKFMMNRLQQLLEMGVVGFNRQLKLNKILNQLWHYAEYGKEWDYPNTKEKITYADAKLYYTRRGFQPPQFKRVVVDDISNKEKEKGI